MSQMTLTIDTQDPKVVREAAEMLLRLSGSVPLALEPQVGMMRHVADASVMLPPFCSEANRTAEDAFVKMPLESPVDGSLPPYVYPDDVVQPITEEEQLEMHVVCGHIDPSQAFTVAQSDAPPPPPPPATVELDSEGMPWDARIHTTARTKIANGTWKLARNTPAELVASVKAEYLGNSVPQSLTTSNVTIVEQKAAHITNTPPPPPPPSIDAPAVDPVRQFMSDIARAGRMPFEIYAALQKHGVQTLQLIRNFPEKIPAIRLELGL